MEIKTKFVGFIAAILFCNNVIFIFPVYGGTSYSRDVRYNTDRFGRKQAKKPKIGFEETDFAKAGLAGGVAAGGISGLAALTPALAPILAPVAIGGGVIASGLALKDISDANVEKLEILKDRFSNSEISLDRFEERLKALKLSQRDQDVIIETSYCAIKVPNSLQKLNRFAAQNLYPQ